MNDGRVAYILGDVDSLEDFTADHVDELRETGIGRFPITKFNVTPSEYADWDKVRGGGYEYDAQFEALIVKAAWGMLHDSISMVFREWFMGISSQLKILMKSTNYPFNYMLRQWRILAVMLDGPFIYSSKEPDVGFYENSSLKPVVAVEIGIGEGRKRLFEDTGRWLEGTQGKTRVVILVDIEEIFPAEKSEGRGDRRDLAYGLSYKELKSSNTTKLAEHILNWHEKHNEALVGNCTAHIYICRRHQRPRKVLRHNFSLDKPGETVYVSDQAFVSISELMNDNSSTLEQQDMEEDDYDAPSDSEDEDSYQSQKLDAPLDEQILLPLDDLKNRMENCLFFERKERAEKRAKAIMRTFAYSSKAR